MGQSLPPRPAQRPQPAQVLKPFGDIGIPALAAATQAAQRRTKENAAPRDIPAILRKDRFHD